jgi:hypothetical protein
MKYFYFLILIVFSNISLAELTSGATSEFIDGKHISVSFEENLIRTSTVGLTSKEKLLRKTAIKLYQNPSNSNYTLDYLEIFPDNLNDFIEVFDNNRNVDIARKSYIYIDLLKQAAIQHPEKGAEVILGISKSACLKGDLMNYLQNALRGFINHSEENLNYSRKFNSKLSYEEPKNLNDFFVAKLYSEDGVGLCKESD